MKVSDDTKSIMAMVAYCVSEEATVQWAWEAVGVVLASAPPSEAVTHAKPAGEPSNDEWKTAWLWARQSEYPNEWLWVKAISKEAHELASLRMSK